ncbi:hypothetical protein G6O69_16975 [Pseudenhygromyxa sp. WMMC2535]|uniref:hypothetical protein n=1 Tax=Pseudenhygromyxa sp. WMMC2535 TaxID=2712867 RepID=UPI001555C3C5|nr:hypothetical protein [Pseudenhygromyxa sp. WMMC2535]NVB39538.1 hypothetical protein [Pseudenhygromyxa sp. WMMC2535]
MAGPGESPAMSGDGNGDGNGDGEAGEAAEPEALLLVSDPAALVALEDAGLSFAALLHEHPEATALAGYGEGPIVAIARELRRVLRANAAEDPTHTGVGLRYVHRQFDLDWLAAEDTRFELIGVVNRMDREVFANPRGQGAAGETRLIYRLAYTREQGGVEVDSRLPMTVNVVFWQPAPGGGAAGEGEGGAAGEGSRGAEARAGRRAVQRRWQADAGLAGTELAAWLRAPGHALDPELLGAAQLEAVEIDVQVERWPSTIRPDMAGHAEYLLEVLRPDPDAPGGYAPAVLENTPDVERLREDAGARAELLAWLRDADQREGLDQGTLTVPDRFLAKAAVSVTPRGFARLANRPFSALFGPEDFADYDFAGMDRVRSPAAALRRLDGLSCQGCHESRSIAGFHLLGAEREADKSVDALAEFASPHLQGELERRRVWHEQLAAGVQPSERRQLSEHERNRGAWGTHCGLGDPGFADWTCDEGLVCAALGDAEIGTCLEPGPGGPGGVCERGEVRTRADHHKDRVRYPEEQPACGPAAACNDNRVGFPDGMCATSCAAAEGKEHAACGLIPQLRGFNDCLSAKRPFATCIAETAFPAALRTCSADAPCRDDYICARTGSEVGVCLPPYFLFQLRVDGHP